MTSESPKKIYFSQLSICSYEGYEPNRLIDTLVSRMRLKNDRALAKILEINSPLISKVRSRALPVSGGLLIRMHEVSGISIAELRALLGDRRKNFRVGPRGLREKRSAKVRSVLDK